MEADKTQNQQITNQQQEKPIITELTEQKEEQEQDNDVIITPNMVENKTNKDIDYTKLIKKFGCFKVTNDHITKIEKLTGKPAHRFITRDIFFSHRDLDFILNAYEKHEDPNTPPFYLYTGRGPSSEALHLGHMISFMFNKYLQETFKVPFIIQLTDDQKYFYKEGDDIKDFTKLAYENLKDILALGFDPEYTFIFIDTQYMGHLYPNVCRFQKHINLTTLKAIFGGLNYSDNCGKAAYPAVQAAPCLSSSFPHIFGDKNYPCIIPCGIDQDPYFRMTRDVCAKLKAPKPAGFYSIFFPALQGPGTKMSASDPNSGIFLNDTPKQIQKKIKKHAFSGGRATRQQQEKYGANLQVDVSYNYLKFFLQSDEQYKEIGEKYGSGKMMTGDVKKILIKVIQDFVKNVQQNRAKITDDDVKKFLSLQPRKTKCAKFL